MNKSNKKIWLGVILGILILVVIILLLMKGCNKEYKITFDTTGGSSIESVMVKKDGTVARPSNPTKEGYEFDNWYYNNQVFDFNTKITSNIILEARWTKKNEGNISLNATSLNLFVGDSSTLIVESTLDVMPELIWSSTNKEVVSVDNNGKVTALNEGTATIEVMTKDGLYKVQCLVTVTEKEVDTVSVSKVTISGKKEVTVGSTIKLTANITPKDATNKSVTWTSSDPKIATVDSKGNVKGIKAGTVTITVTTEDGGKIATIKIIVKEKAVNDPKPETPSEEDKNVSVTGVSISGARDVYVNNSITLTANITPTNATNKKVTWKSSDENIATVDQNGKVTGKKEGKVTITVTTEDGKKEATYDVTVNSKYIITMTKSIMEGTGGNIQYEVVLTKDGVVTDFVAYIYNGKVKKSPYIDASEVNTNISSVEVTTSTGKHTATVVYK